MKKDELIKQLKNRGIVMGTGRHTTYPINVIILFNHGKEVYKAFYLQRGIVNKTSAYNELCEKEDIDGKIYLSEDEIYDDIKKTYFLDIPSPKFKIGNVVMNLSEGYRVEIFVVSGFYYSHCDSKRKYTGAGMQRYYEESDLTIAEKRFLVGKSK